MESTHVCTIHPVLTGFTSLNPLPYKHTQTQDCLRRQEEQGQQPSTSTTRRPPSNNNNHLPPSSSNSKWADLQAHFPPVLECPGDPDVHCIVLRGLYAFSYEYFSRFFPPESLHVVTQEEMKVRVRLCGHCGGGRFLLRTQPSTSNTYTHRWINKGRWRGWWTFWASAPSNSPPTWSPST